MCIPPWFLPKIYKDNKELNTDSNVSLAFVSKLLGYCFFVAVFFSSNLWFTRVSVHRRTKRAFLRIPSVRSPWVLQWFSGNSCHIGYRFRQGILNDFFSLVAKILFCRTKYNDSWWANNTVYRQVTYFNPSVLSNNMVTSP